MNFVRHLSKKTNQQDDRNVFMAEGVCESESKVRMKMALGVYEVWVGRSEWKPVMWNTE